MKSLHAGKKMTIAEVAAELTAAKKPKGKK
jgi:hypothetical protein